MKKECVAMLLAGGQGSRLYVLTGNMAKPAVPFGGKFRIIDFPLSNCTNSGIDTVGVLTQYRPLELNSYIGSGQPWELDRMSGGVHILPPYQSATGAVWYKGTANAIYQNRGFVDLYDPEYVLVLSGDHIYKMDYSDMLRRHKEAGAACTISVMEVPWEEASRFGIMSVDGQDRITEFAEKPREPKSNLASMGIYIFTWSKLKAYLAADEADPNSDNDFGKNIIPAMLSAGETMAAYRFEGYWKDVGTLDSLWDANMDMLSPGSGLNLLDKKWPIYGRTPNCPPTFVGPEGDIGNSAVAKGCTILGEVKNTVLSYGSSVAEGAQVSYSVVMPNAVIEAGARVSYAIVGEGCHVGKNAVVDYNINRENLLPSEKAKAYKLKLDAMKRSAGRPAKNSAQVGQNFEGRFSVEILAEQVNESRMQIQRYIRLTNLIPPLMEAVDAGKLKFVPAADYISHLTEKEQTYLQFLMERDEVSPSVDQAQRLKQISAEGKLENNIIDLIMREEKPLERKVTLRNDRLQKYFPPSYTPKQMEEVIIKLLEGWHRRRQQEQVR